MGISLYEQFQREQQRDAEPKPKPSSLYEQYLAEQAAPRAEPNALSRGLSLIKNAVTHLPETAVSLVTAPVESAARMIAPSVEDAKQLDADPDFQARNIARFGGEMHPKGVTGKERAAAIAQTAANVVAPRIAGAVSELAAPVVGKFIGRAAGAIGAGMLGGAAYNPNDPAAGAIAGGIAAPVAEATVRGVAKGGTKVGELGSIAKRTVQAAPLDETAVAMTKETAAADRANYGRAADEAATAGGTSDALKSAFEDEGIKPFVEAVRSSRRFVNADDATIAREAFKLISRQRRGLQKRMDVSGYDAKLDLEAGDLAEAAKVLKAATAAPGTKEIPALTTAQSPAPTLRDAINDFHTAKGVAAARTEGTPAQQLARTALERHHAEASLPPITGSSEPTIVETPAVMPSFPEAVAEHARAAGTREAFNTVADATRRVMRDASIPAKKLDTQSSAAIIDDIRNRPNPDGTTGWTKEQADAGLKALFGRAKGNLGISLDRNSTLFGTVFQAPVEPISKINRLSPIVRALDEQAGSRGAAPIDLDAAMRALVFTTGPAVQNPDERKIRRAMDRLIQP